LSVFRILLLQRTPKLGRTKPSTVPHAASWLDISDLAYQSMVPHRKNFFLNGAAEQKSVKSLGTED